MEGLNINPFTHPVVLLEDSICHHTWLVNGDEVNLIQRADKLFHEVINKEEGVYLRGSLPFPSYMSIGSAISILSRQQVYMPDRETVGFCETLDRFDVGNIELTLLNDKDGPIWQLLDKANQKTEWQKFSAIFLSKECHKETWDIFEIFKQKDNESEKRKQFFKSFREDFTVIDVFRLKKTEVLKTEENFDLEAKVRKAITKTKKIKRESLSFHEKLNLPEKFILIRNNFPMHPVFSWHLNTCEECKKWCSQKEIEELQKDEQLSLLNRGSDNILLKLYKLNKNFIIYGGTDERNKLFERVTKIAIYKTLLKNPTASFLESEQKSELKEINPLIDEKKRKNLLISERIKALVEEAFPFFVIIEPKTFKSNLDKNVHISKLRWAATIVSYGGPSQTSDGQHAEIIIEGINDGYFPEKSIKGNEYVWPKGHYFMLLLHLTGPKNIEVKFIEPSEFKCHERTQVQLRSSEKLKKMISSITFEKDEAQIEFSILGAYSPFSGGFHSCITWALDHFKKAGMDLGWPAFGLFFTQTKSYTQSLEYYENNPIFQKI